MQNSIAKKVAQLQGTIAPIHKFCTESSWAKRELSELDCDFTFGNPHEMPLDSYVTALQTSLHPQTKDWFAYKQSETRAQEVIAATLSQRYMASFLSEDICMTNGAIAGLNLVLNSIVNPGDEVIYMTPHWFLYEGLILEAGGEPVPLSLKEETYDLGLEAISGAITPRTRAVIINSPHNPSGRIVEEGQLEELSKILTRASDKIDGEIFLISDEAYSQIVFDDVHFQSPVTFYENSFLVYTYGKVHLTPGQRIGYVAMPETMQNREELREAINTLQMFKGWAFPNALLQHAIEDLEEITIDVKELEARRDLLIESLSSFGYMTIRPQSTFYLLVKSPFENDWEFTELLAQDKVYCLPGETFGLPGYFRISLTANQKMIDRALPFFEKALSTRK